MLSDATCAYLLALARATLAKHIGATSVDPGAAPPEAHQPCGAFVSLHTREPHNLRGCIGTFAFERPLVDNVRQMAIACGTEDPRFPPVRKDELPQLVFEISAMTPPSPIRAEDVVVGTHGLLVAQGVRRGVLLPQVPVEWGWNREEFLAQTCRKAGLPMDAWKHAETKIDAFTAQVFHE